jgi:hypothetical protein
MNQMQSPFKTERKTIDGHTVESTVLPGLFALRLKTRLMKKIFPSIGKFVSSVKIDQLKESKKTFGDVLECLDMEGVGNALEAVAANVEPAELQEIILQTLSQTRVDNKEAGNEDIFNLLFAGKMMLMYRIFLFALEVNYGDFLAVLRTGMDKMTPPVPETPKSTTSSKAPSKQ